MMDDLIQETSAKLNALGELQDTPEKPMAGGLVGIDFEHGQEPPPGGSSRHDDCPGGCKTRFGC